MAGVEQTDGCEGSVKKDGNGDRSQKLVELLSSGASSLEKLLRAMYNPELEVRPTLKNNLW